MSVHESKEGRGTERTQGTERVRGNDWKRRMRERQTTGAREEGDELGNSKAYVRRKELGKD